MKNSPKKNKKKLKAFSLVEMLVTMAIISILIVMLSDTLLVTLDVSVKALARSNTREEQTNIINRMEKDIRNARIVEACSGSGTSASCTVILDKRYTWKYCARADGTGNICKMEYDASGNEVQVDGFSENIIVESFSIEEGFSDSPAKVSILISTVVSHRNERLGINNQVRQALVSTRNYSI